MYALRDLLARFGLEGMSAFWATIGMAVAAVVIPQNLVGVRIID
jgi:hypothetical protein